MSAEEAWQEWEKSDFGRNHWSMRQAFMAGYRRALEDATDDMGKELDTFPRRGANTRARWAENWLRFRAAAAAPRETKD